MTGARSSICCAVKLSMSTYFKSGLEDNYIKNKCQQYTENLYRRDTNINNIYKIYMRMNLVYYK